MKPINLVLLVLILLVGVANLLVSFGVLGGGGSQGNFEYKLLSVEEMDKTGIGAVAAERDTPLTENGTIDYAALAKKLDVPVSEDGTAQIPREHLEPFLFPNLLPRTIQEMTKNGGWEFVESLTLPDGVTYLFRRSK